MLVWQKGIIKNIKRWFFQFQGFLGLHSPKQGGFGSFSTNQNLNFSKRALHVDTTHRKYLD